MKSVVLAAVLSMSAGLAVRAEEPVDEAKKEAVLEEARQHVAKAKVHYDLGEFKQAADEYIIVYRLRPIPALLFNIAQAYRQAGMYDQAKSFYKSYLREVPDAKNKASIETSIHEMDQLMAKEKKTREAPPSGVKEPAEASLPIKTAAKTDAARPGAPSQVPAEWAKPAAAKPAEKAPEKAAAATPEKPAAPAATPAQPAPAKVAVATTPAPAGSPSAAPQKSTTAAPASSPWTAPHRAPIAATSKTPAPQVRSSSHTATWVAAGAAGVALAAGGVFGYKTLDSRSTSDASKANLLYGIGGGLAVLSGALFLMDF